MGSNYESNLSHKTKLCKYDLPQASNGEKLQWVSLFRYLFSTIIFSVNLFSTLSWLLNRSGTKLELFWKPGGLTSIKCYLHPSSPQWVGFRHNWRSYWAQFMRIPSKPASFFCKFLVVKSFPKEYIIEHNYQWLEHSQALMALRAMLHEYMQTTCIILMITQLNFIFFTLFCIYWKCNCVKSF